MFVTIFQHLLKKSTTVSSLIDHLLQPSNISTVSAGTVTQTLQTSKQLLRIVDTVQKCYLATKNGKPPMPLLHHQVSSAAQDVSAAKWNQRSKQEWNWVIFMYYSASTFCWVLSVPSQPRWTLSVSGRSCHGHGRTNSGDNWFYTSNLGCYVDFLCSSAVWDAPCQSLSCAKKGLKRRQNWKFKVKKEKCCMLIYDKMTDIMLIAYYNS